MFARHLTKFLLGMLCLLFSASAWAAGKTELTWYGQSAFKIVTPAGHVLFIDPWIVNPVNSYGAQDLAQINKADLILVSHGHFDHVGNAVEIAKKTKARLVATYDLGNALVAYAGYPKDQIGFDSMGNFGGTLRFFDNEVAITFIPAIHSSAVNSPQETPEFAGNPGGFLISVKNGPTIYHTGDTDLFGDMALIRQHHPVDIMLACIGDHFTMGPAGAASAVALVKPAHVVPMHFGTFPILTGTVADFRAALKTRGLDGKLMPMVIGKPIEL